MPRPWALVLTSFYNTPIFSRIWFSVAGLGVYALVVCVLDHYFTSKFVNIQASIHTLLGLVLGMLLVFRTNTSYDRWWEGRRLWGQLVNESRNLAVKLQTCVQADEAQKRQVAVWLIDFAEALKEHLRCGVKLRQLEGFADSTDDPPHVPLYLARAIYDRIEHWRRAEQLGGFELLFIDRHAAALMDVCGACERIKKTPISLSYRWFIRQSIALYLATLPWGLVEDLNFWTVPVTIMIGYFMIGVELIAEEIEDPFGIGEDDIMLDDICLTIRRSVEQIVGMPSEKATDTA